MPPKQSQSIIGRITCFRGGHAEGGYYDPVDIDSGDLIEVPVEDIPFVGLMVFNVPQGPFFLKKMFFFWGLFVWWKSIVPFRCDLGPCEEVHRGITHP